MKLKVSIDHENGRGSLHFEKVGFGGVVDVHDLSEAGLDWVLFDLDREGFVVGLEFEEVAEHFRVFDLADAAFSRTDDVAKITFSSALPATRKGFDFAPLGERLAEIFIGLDETDRIVDLVVTRASNVVKQDILSSWEA